MEQALMQRQQQIIVHLQVTSAIGLESPLPAHQALTGAMAHQWAVELPLLLLPCSQPMHPHSIAQGYQLRLSIHA